MKEVFVDTNIFLRFLLADHPRQSPAARRLFAKAAKGRIKLITLPIVMAEIVWVLASFFKESRIEITRKIRIILLFKNLEIPDRQALLEGIQLYETLNIDFIDAYIAGWLKAKKKVEICSFDQDFAKVEGLKRLKLL